MIITTKKPFHALKTQRLIYAVPDAQAVTK